MAVGNAPTGTLNVTLDNDCPSEFCQGWCAANALHNRDSNCLYSVPSDADLQRVVVAWDTLLPRIRKTVLALVGFVDLPDTDTAWYVFVFKPLIPRRKEIA
jgi:hypothetical protein